MEIEVSSKELDGDELEDLLITGYNLADLSDQSLAVQIHFKEPSIVSQNLVEPDTLTVRFLLSQLLINSFCRSCSLLSSFALLILSTLASIASGAPALLSSSAPLNIASCFAPCVLDLLFLAFVGDFDFFFFSFLGDFVPFNVFGLLLDVGNDSPFGLGCASIFLAYLMG